MYTHLHDALKDTCPNFTTFHDLRQLLVRRRESERIKRVPGHLRDTTRRHDWPNERVLAPLQSEEIVQQLVVKAEEVSEDDVERLHQFLNGRVLRPLEVGHFVLDDKENGLKERFNNILYRICVRKDSAPLNLPDS